ncbi:MAG: glutamate synthase (NADPH), homotetrameric [Spirochaetae bacterium HGW-Spirochaetae-7]|nr:MAG: glutamate synthase (NADPH), homotetrameric [Spirochaetae bacterium HGW-Spirochaetae-7]
MSGTSTAGLAEAARKVLAGLDGKQLANKDRMAIPAQDMPCQEPGIRAHNMDEVALGYTEAQARVEAARCLQCKNAPCVPGCPVSIDIPGFVGLVASGDYHGAAEVIRKTNLLPAICGRVCPQEKQCQAPCTLGKALKGVERAVQIGRLERYVADRERASGGTPIPHVAPPTGKRVAVIGAGPAGLTVAAEVRREGHEVVIFEAFQKPGGVMVYGIPEFRLPKAIVREEADKLERMGVRFELNTLIGRTIPLPALLQEDGFDAAFVGVGAGLPKFMDIPGENFVGVFSANEYLTRCNMMRAWDRERASTPIYPSKRVAVLGGGNVAMDSARMALRLGAEEVRVLYRRTREEMPARAEEVEHAMEEGIVFDFLSSPTEVLGNDKGVVTGLRVMSYRLGDPDESGRRSPVAIDGSEHEVHFDTVIVAVGNESNPLIAKTTPGLNVDRKSHVLVDASQKTSLDAVWAGGDIVLGAATVILAMGEGRRAAAAINEYLGKK